MTVNNEIHDNRGNAVQAGHIDTLHLHSAAPPPTALDGLLDASKSFTGREPELAELTGASGLTVISGLAGVGKTELALRYAESGEFPGGKLFVDLHDYDDKRRVTPAKALEGFLSELGVREIPPTEAARTALFRTITASREPMLVIIDNARFVPHVRPLLPNRHRTIVTSRHRLAALDDAHHLELGVLPLEEAAALVGDPELAEPCGRLPLALRIMAALRRTDPGHDWVAELREVKLDLLDDGEERSVRAAFELSYRALTEEQARLFRRAGLSPATEVTAEAASVLTGCTEARARKLLRDLRTAHLLEPGDRFHDLVLEFAGERMREEETEGTSNEEISRLVHHFADRAEQMDAALDTPKQAEALHWFDRHRSMFVPLALCALLMSHFREGGRLAWAVHRYLEARGHLDDLTMADTLTKDAGVNLGDAWMTAVAQIRLGHTLLRTGDDERALAHLHHAWKVVRGSHDRALLRRALEGLVEAFERNNRAGEARLAAADLARLIKDDSR
ncbi:ATP-binding protein [Lentzea sp. NEAU-D13]|uniref:ATP-binding protein n=1 Tax=Lentzea alba TaxID=2714351 RepID=A0A7C9W6I9_9PSEU|nr:ATP-binding protein [Lentzea alba]NGY65717.1 ATP-binding protein [Lentzea alba]